MWSQLNLTKFRIGMFERSAVEESTHISVGKVTSFYTNSTWYLESRAFNFRSRNLVTFPSNWILVMEDVIWEVSGVSGQGDI